MDFSILFSSEYLMGYVLAFMVIGLASGFYVYLNNLYPKLRFKIFRGKLISTEYHRRIGDKIVTENLLSIILKHNKLSGTDIKEFEDTEEVTSKFMLFHKLEKTYCATRVEDMLFPMHLEYIKNEGNINTMEIKAGKDIAAGMIVVDTLMDSITEKRNTIWQLIIVSLAFAVPLILFFVGMWISNEEFIKLHKEVIGAVQDLYNTMRIEKGLPPMESAAASPQINKSQIIPSSLLPGG